LPSFFALGHGLVGNPELLPETVSAWDAGFEWQALQSLEITASTFFNEYEDLIDFDAEAFTNVNRRRVESKGAEWLVSWRPAVPVTVKMHATYTDIDVVGEDVKLLGRPEWKAGAWLDWQLTPKWRSGFDYAWNGAVPASSLHTGQSVVSVIDDYHRLDWRLSWQPAPVLSAELAVDNLLGANYETAVGFPAPGRMLRLSLTWQYSG
jgi:outer membrane cobalamin receptor